MSNRYLEPNYGEVLTLFKEMDNDSLHEFINEDDKVDEIIKSCQQLKEIETEKELIMAQNKSLAEYNMSYSPKLEDGKNKLKELCDSLQSLRDTVQEKQSELRNHPGNLSTDTILALLQTAAAESEEESEKIAEKFYLKEIEIEEFLDQFQTFRKLMHLRRVKADKMNDILKKKQKGGSSVTPSYKLPAPYEPTPTPQRVLPYPIAATSVPYPIGGPYMPHYPGLN